MEIFENILKTNGIEVYILQKYVDDIFLCLKNLHLDPPGLSRSRHTLNELLKIANGIFPFLKFRGEIPTDAPMPVLDTEFWVGKPTNNGPWYKGEGNLHPLEFLKIKVVATFLMYSFYKKTNGT